MCLDAPCRDNPTHRAYLPSAGSFGGAVIGLSLQNLERPPTPHRLGRTGERTERLERVHLSTPFCSEKHEQDIIVLVNASVYRLGSTRRT
jgi:hypothetical protein